MKAGLARERGVGIIGLLKMFTEAEEKEVELNEMENIDEELKTPSKYMKTLIENYGIEPKNLKVSRKSPKIKGAKFNTEQKIQENTQQLENKKQIQSMEDEEKSL